MARWHRIPFTCSYMPGKRFVGHTLLMGVVAYAVFTTGGWALVTISAGHPRRWLMVMGALLGAAVLLRRRRNWWSARTALMFEDVLPAEAQPLQVPR